MLKNKSRCRGQFVFSATYLSGLLLLAPTATRADFLSIQFQPNTGTCSITGSNTHENATCGNGAFVASGSASYGSLSSSIDTIVGGQGEVTAIFSELVNFSRLGFVQCPPNPGLTDCPVGNVKNYPSGSTLTGQVVFSLNGTYDWHSVGGEVIEVLPETIYTYNSVHFPR
jgi:hypothetical protein